MKTGTVCSQFMEGRKEMIYLTTHSTHFIYLRLYGAVHGRQRVNQGRGEPMTCVQAVVPYSGVSVMAWGGICGQERTRQVVVNGNLTSQRYVDDILRPTVLPISPTAATWCHLSAR